MENDNFIQEANKKQKTHVFNKIPHENILLKNEINNLKEIIKTNEEQVSQLKQEIIEIEKQKQDLLNKLDESDDNIRKIQVELRKYNDIEDTLKTSYEEQIHNLKDELNEMNIKLNTEEKNKSMLETKYSQMNLLYIRMNTDFNNLKIKYDEIINNNNVNVNSNIENEDNVKDVEKGISVKEQQNNKYGKYKIKKR